MSTNAYNDLLTQAESALTSNEKRRFAEQLVRSADSGAVAGNEKPLTKSLYDVLNEREMIGSITDSPGDLSTNPKYMEGFGQDER